MLVTPYFLSIVIKYKFNLVCVGSEVCESFLTLILGPKKWRNFPIVNCITLKYVCVMEDVPVLHIESENLLRVTGPR